MGKAFSAVTHDRESIRSITDQIATQKTALLNLRGELNGLEKKLSRTNQKFLSKISNREKISDRLQEQKNILKLSEERIREKLLVLRRVLSQYLLNSIDEEETIESLYEKKLLQTSLKEKVKILKAHLLTNKSLRDEVSSLELKFKKFRSVESSLHQIIIRMEKKKQDFAKSYLSAVDKQTLLKDRLSTLKEKERLENSYLKKKVKNNIWKKELKNLSKLYGTFIQPLDKPMSRKIKKKGLQLTYKGTKPFRSPQEGEVVYSGKVTSLGDVVMIDHGENLRSVILGQLNLKVQKGSRVKRGQLLGYTMSKNGRGQLYFELRQKNLVQDTIHWLQK